MSLFGAEVGNMASGINRSRLGNLVFPNPAKRDLLSKFCTCIRERKQQFIQHNNASVKKMFWMCRCYLRRVGTATVIG